MQYSPYCTTLYYCCSYRTYRLAWFNNQNIPYHTVPYIGLSFSLLSPTATALKPCCAYCRWVLLSSTLTLIMIRLIEHSYATNWLVLFEQQWHPLQDYPAASKRFASELLSIISSIDIVKEEIKVFCGVPILISLLKSDNIEILPPIVCMYVCL